MARTRPLVGGYLERISVKAFDQYQSEITGLVKNKHGVYALYKGDRLYYVGLAVNLRRRIRQHLKDRHAGKWNRFSLYLVRKVDHIKEIESLILRIADPKGNKQSGKLMAAKNMRRELRVAMHARMRNEIDALFASKRRPVARDSKKRTTPTRTTKSVRPLQGVFRGSKRIYRNYLGKEYKAIVYHNGRIQLRRKWYDTPTAAARSITKRAVNGWLFWRVKEGGNFVPLRKYRP